MQIYEVCPKTCGTCSTSVPSAAPSIAPTRAPSTSPTVCEDDDCIVAGDSHTLVPLCDYAAADLSGRCDLSYGGKGLIKDYCRYTCYVCRSIIPLVSIQYALNIYLNQFRSNSANFFDVSAKIREATNECLYQNLEKVYLFAHGREYFRPNAASRNVRVAKRRDATDNWFRRFANIRAVTAERLLSRRRSHHH